MTLVCSRCRAEFERPKPFGVLPKFCSDDCRYDKSAKVCEGCGADFIANGPQRFCTKQCFRGSDENIGGYNKDGYEKPRVPRRYEDPVFEPDKKNVVAFADMNGNEKLLHLEYRHHQAGPVHLPHAENLHLVMHASAEQDHDHSAARRKPSDPATHPDTHDQGSEAQISPSPGSEDAPGPSCNCAQIRIQCFHVKPKPPGLTPEERAANWAVDLQNPDYVPDSTIRMDDRQDGHRPGHYTPRPWDLYGGLYSECLPRTPHGGMGEW